jgi:hypothetical protein
MDNIFCALHFESLVNEAENKEHTFVLTIPCPILNKNFHVVPFVFFYQSNIHSGNCIFVSSILFYFIVPVRLVLQPRLLFVKP